ncbi:MAG: thrombospondin type 3 repeat-containing protein, partial [Polyangiales bacterium]
MTAEYSLAPAVGVTLGGAYTALSQGAVDPARGIAQPGVGGFGTLTAGLRLRPLARRDVGGEGLWLGLEGGVGFSGDVARPAYAASLGYAFSVASTVSLGPWVGFTSLVQTDGQDLRDDARLVLAGLSLSLGPATRAAAPPPPPPPPPRRCPAITGQALPDADGDGCAEQDRDGDAIADASDRCPDAPEDRDGHDDADGCPDPDNDGDGILDASDRCPNEPEVVNGVDDTDGCPDVAEARVVRGRIILEERARFPYASSRVTPEARAAVLAVARIMSTHPEYAVLS